jgi:hypothetical protein
MKVSDFNTELLSQKEMKSIEGGYWKLVWEGAKWIAKSYVGSEIKKGFIRGMESDCTDVCSA